MDNYYVFQNGNHLYAIKNTRESELEMLFSNAREQGRNLILDKVVATSEEAAVSVVKNLKAFHFATCAVGLLNIGCILGVQETPFNMVIFIGVTIAFLWGANSYQKMLSPELKELHKNKHK